MSRYIEQSANPCSTSLANKIRLQVQCYKLIDEAIADIQALEAIEAES